MLNPVNQGIKKGGEAALTDVFYGLSVFEYGVEEFLFVCGVGVLYFASQTRTFVVVVGLLVFSDETYCVSWNSGRDESQEEYVLVFYFRQLVS